jgi:hypothetical protein
MHVRDETKAPASFTLHNAFGCITLLFSVACVFQDLRPVVRHPCPCPRPSHATPTPRPRHAVSHTASASFADTSYTSSAVVLVFLNFLAGILRSKSSSSST